MALIRIRCDSLGGVGIKVGGRPGRMRVVKARGPQPFEAQTQKRSAVCRQIHDVRRRMIREESASGLGAPGEGDAREYNAVA